MCNEMPYDELLGWIAYFDKRPVGWREDDRTMKLLQAQGVDKKPGDIFPSLAIIGKPDEVEVKDNVVSADKLKQSLFFAKMINARGGDKLEF
jgi:hypothetical protein